MKAQPFSYQHQLLDLLGPYEEEITRRLRAFVALPVESDVTHVHFEDCSDPHGKKFPVLIALTTATNHVYSDARRGALSAMPFALPPSLNPAVSDCGVDDASEEWTAAFFPWFQRCWIVAGGLSYSVPASIGERDATESFDLTSGRWINAR